MKGADNERRHMMILYVIFIVFIVVCGLVGMGAYSYIRFYPDYEILKWFGIFLSYMLVGATGMFFGLISVGLGFLKKQQEIIKKLTKGKKKKNG
jgi:hypothetical protein